MVNKVQVKKELKPLGLENVHYTCSDFVHKGKSIKVNDKFVQGIFGASHSPMDVTSQAFERVSAKGREIKSILSRFMKLEQEDDWGFRFVVNPDTKKEFRVNLHCKKFPSYPRSSNMDPDYLSSWWILKFA